MSQEELEAGLEKMGLGRTANNDQNMSASRLGKLVSKYNESTSLTTSSVSLAA